MTEINPGMNWPAQQCQRKRVNVVRRVILHSHRARDVTGGDTQSPGADSYRMGMRLWEAGGFGRLQWNASHLPQETKSLETHELTQEVDGVNQNG